ncbi:hypothetical protein [Frankia sp. Cr2]|uniref:hypothetical protein n=1 Tax=Frankia sp. Cr2 TaxID=3073932 RepID=UPI002AD54603|nr:hypothetical protein [Frankia sp. Cr2]
MDITSIVAQLSQAPTADSRELDRRCESVASTLFDAGVEPPFDVASADFVADPWLICADRYWRRRFLQEPTVAVAAQCARWLGEHAAGPHRGDITEKWSLGYAFITKETVESREDLTLATGRIIERFQGSSDICCFATLYHAGKLRANFWFDELYQFLDASLLAVAADRHRRDPLFISLRAFAAFGSRTITTEYATELLDQAWTASPRSRHVVDVCLNALWAASPFDDQGEQLRQHAAEAVAEYPDDHIFHFRLATGQRMCGRYDEALRNIDSALRLLPAIGSRVSHKLLQEQYLHEREMIKEGRQRANWASEQQDRWRQQEEANQDLRHTLATSAVRAIELVTIFTAAIAFTVGSLQITLSGSLTLHDRMWLLVTLGAGLLLFALVIIAGTWVISGRRSGRRG